MRRNTITANFRGPRKIALPAIRYQHDVGQVLLITGLDLPVTYKVDFCNDGDAVTKPITGTSEGVLIPDEYLVTGRTIKAYIVLSNTDAGAGDVETVYEITIPVIGRPEPTDITPTPAEQQEIDTLIDAVNGAVGKVENMSVSAESLAAGSEATVEKTESGGVAHLAFGIPRGDKGDTGGKGDPGDDGFSPTATVTKSGKTATISITDANGTTTATVSDGTDGTDGVDGDDGVTFTPSVSSAGVISWTNDGGKTNPQSVDLVAAVIAALPSAVGVSF